ncbi:F-box domain-containing protein [Aspergillus fumigatus Z5]|nr:F-box domain-containing protein [Aspergillus fumigatus Z5]
MAYPFRRAGEKLKTVAKMDTWVRDQSREQSTTTKPPTRCYLLELPTELLLEIISHLSVIPETCLALTCKRLFAISGAIFTSVRYRNCLISFAHGLKSTSLIWPSRFSQDFAPLFHHYRNGHNFVTTRWQLISILENSRWWACSKCLKLHPRDAFSSRELKRKPEDRACLLGNFAGIVDLCPCKKLTFRDKMDLVELLKVRQRSVADLQSQFGASIQQRFCWHSCTKDYGPTQLQIEIYPELDDQDQLRIKTEYRLTTESGKLGKEEYITPRFGCAHRSVDLWLSSCSSVLEGNLPVLTRTQARQLTTSGRKDALVGRHRRQIRCGLLNVYIPLRIRLKSTIAARHALGLFGSIPLLPAHLLWEWISLLQQSKISP